MNQDIVCRRYWHFCLRDVLECIEELRNLWRPPFDEQSRADYFYVKVQILEIFNIRLGCQLGYHDHREPYELIVQIDRRFFNWHNRQLYGRTDPNSSQGGQALQNHDPNNGQNSQRAEIPGASMMIRAIRRNESISTLSSASMDRPVSRLSCDENSFALAAISPMGSVESINDNDDTNAFN
ncbi:unnamed protein product [Caenorhabditis bovis]|nr:unnamed protein product [Caenorhabditis bovis]